MKDRIHELANKYFDRIRQHREYLHRHPELSFKEYNTSKYIQDTLDLMGVSYKTGIGGETGIVAEIGSGEKLIALRGDIDALPINEVGTHDYKSQYEGVMHACGHDVHTSCVLGAAMILKELENELTCRVRFIFQPGEEKLPGGASFMIRDGVLDGVDLILGQHVHPDLYVGSMGYAPGYSMASADEIYIKIKGKGGHAAMPEKCKDPIMAGLQLIQALNKIMESEKSNHNIPTVLSIGKFNTLGGATNVIPEVVKMEGTFRTYDEDWRVQAHQIMEKVAGEVAGTSETIIDFNIIRGYPCLYNDPDLTDSIREGMEEFLGEEAAINIPSRMTAEDFAYYSHEVPACFYRLGTSRPDGSFSSSVHTPTFDVDPEALKIGSGFMAYMALKLASDH